jgi:hypothetical protein
MRNKYHLLNLRDDNYIITEYQEPPKRIRKIGIVQIDRSVFKKSKVEKELLKDLKAQNKMIELRKNLHNHNNKEIGAPPR